MTISNTIYFNQHFQQYLEQTYRINYLKYFSFDKNLSLDEKKANIYGIEDVFKYKIREA